MLVRRIIFNINGVNRSIKPSYLLKTSRKLSYIVDLDDDSDKWPISMVNIGMNKCPQGQHMVIERNGRFYREIESGTVFFALPFYDRIKYVVDMRERAIRINNSSALTKDQARIGISCIIYCKFTDSQKAAYGSINPLYAIRQHTQTAIRYLIAESDLDQIIGSNKAFSSIIKDTIESTVADWGFTITRCEILDLTPHKSITDTIDKNAASELERKHQLLQADNNKKIAEIESSSEKMRIQLEGEGIASKIEYEAKARKEAAIIKAEGDAIAFEIKVASQAKAIKTLTAALAAEGSYGTLAAKMVIANNYVSMYGELGQKSNTVIFGDKPADIANLLEEAEKITSGSTTSSSKPSSV